MQVADVVPVKARFFGLKDVQLLDGSFKHAMDKDVEYLLWLEPDRLLHRFYLHAGLPVKAPIYGGWESQGISGHTLGHYLSALATGWAATSDHRLLERLTYTVDALEQCQKARKTGYIGGIPGEDSVFADIAARNIHSAGFDLNGLWVPWYTIHKLFAGLEDAYLYTNNKKALEIAIRFGDWVSVITQKLSPDDWQKMLACEHGGMNEVLANLYALTGKTAYLDLSQKFHHREVLDPLAARQDVLPGKHANTQIPKVIGCIRRYELTGNRSDRDLSEYFWNTVVDHHTYVIGGNSNHEHFGKPDQLSEQLSENTTETCNTNNMLKLTRHLFALEPSARMMDYYERALWNHILASQNPQDGMMCYYVPLKMRGEKLYSHPENDFWCCVGTGIENHVKYGESIYAEAADGGLFVNLYMPSVLRWSAKNLDVRQETNFPNEGATRLIFSGKSARQKFPVHLRFPAWAKTMRLTINGKSIPVSMASRGSYVTVNRAWRGGDQLECSFDMALTMESMPDNPKRVAFLYGPIVLAAALGGMPVDSMYDAPVLVTNVLQPEKWLKPLANQPLHFISQKVGYPYDVELAPFYQTHGQPYSVYMDLFTSDDLTRKKTAYEAEKRRMKDLEARTIDVLRIGEMQPERDHHVTGENTTSGGLDGRKWRHAVDGGWFAFDLKVDAVLPNVLQCTYWGSDSGNRVFDILVEGEKIATQTLQATHPNAFFDVPHELPIALTKGKNVVHVRLQAHPGATAGGLFGARMLRKN
jgi:hypothetical protein